MPFYIRRKASQGWMPGLESARNWEHTIPMTTLPNTGELWTVREDLRSNWSPDRKFVDGRIEERNLGET